MLNCEGWAALWLATILVLGIGLAIELWPRVAGRLNRRNNAGRALNAESYEEALAACRRAVVRPLEIAPQSSGFRALRLAMKARRGVPRADDFGYACLALGLSTAYRQFGRREDLEALGELMDRLLTSDGQLRHKPTGVRECMIGYTVLEMLDLTGEPRYRAAADAIAGALRELPRSPTGTFPWSGRYASLLLVDTLSMVCPFLIRYGEVTGDRQATELGVQQMKEYLEKGRHGPNGMPFHAYRCDNNEVLGLLGWTRGFGWLVLGLTETVTFLSPAHPDYAFFRSTLTELLELAGRYQLPEGGWGWCLHIPDSRLDTSGTAIIGYTMERSMERGWMGTGWRDVTNRVADTLVRSMGKDGSILGAMTDCPWLGEHPQVFGKSAMAQGPACALFALARKRTAPAS